MRFRWIARAAALWLCIGGATAAFGAAASPQLGEVGAVAAMPRDSGLPDGWDRKGVFVEILVRAYQDSNGDGIGDLNGVTQRLDYLQSLGIRGIWLMPITASQDHDHGYAPVNYRDIEPAYGTLADFDRLVAEAHKRGIGVILDYVINHSGSAHPLFEAAAADRQSPYRDWYVFSDTEMKGWTTYGGDPWRANGDDWYYGAFDVIMPDWNLRNPAVVDFHLDNLRFWLNRGVDGFRFDAVGVLYENGPIAWDNQPENHVLMKRAQDLLASYGKRYMVCEAASDPEAFSGEDSCGSAFSFGLQKYIIKSIQMGRVMPDLRYMLRTMPVARMGTILSSHDYYAGARPFKQFGGDEPRYKLAAATLLTLPGHPFLYYGEEIGLSHAQPVDYQDQSIRGPMSWSAEANAGFSTTTPFRPLVDNWRTHNVAAEEANTDSLLNWYRQLIALRNAHPALQTGDFTLWSQDDDAIFAFTREAGGEKLLVLINYSAREASIAAPADFDAAAWVPVFPAATALRLGQAAAPKGKRSAKASEAPSQIRVAPQSLQVFRLAP
ncbi:alpha-amylase family glycosyl hydrolase [Niveibacterium sp.]|uniref:alpha-amylase family glycosyl hydrolase n=1 Tax=Niveibacterium sp. TaxID=2017444 RepID=UPI0035AFAB1E